MRRRTVRTWTGDRGPRTWPAPEWPGVRGVKVRKPGKAGKAGIKPENRKEDPNPKNPENPKRITRKITTDRAATPSALSENYMSSLTLLK